MYHLDKYVVVYDACTDTEYNLSNNRYQFSDTQILSYSDTQIRRYADTQILRYAMSDIEISDIRNACHVSFNKC